jgi:hypothetical protein
MIKAPLVKGYMEVVVGHRYATPGDPHKFEAHIYLDKGSSMHGGVGDTPASALFEAVKHWREAEDKT